MIDLGVLITEEGVKSFVMNVMNFTLVEYAMMSKSTKMNLM
jgi:hypothetical protein